MVVDLVHMVAHFSFLSFDWILVVLRIFLSVKSVREMRRSHLLRVTCTSVPKTLLGCFAMIDTIQNDDDTLMTTFIHSTWQSHEWHNKYNPMCGIHTVYLHSIHYTVYIIGVYIIKYNNVCALPGEHSTQPPGQGGIEPAG